MTKEIDKIPSVAVSVIVTLHNEGILAYKTLRNIENSIIRAKRKLIICEVLIGLDNADTLTRQVAANFKSRIENFECKIFESDFKDPGMSRNNLINHAIGKYIFVRDGDDLFTENFITAAYRQAQLSNKPKVYIAEFLVNFDAQHYMIPMIPSDSPLISKRFLFETNYYTSNYFIPRKALGEIRYAPSENGYGYEDWQLTTRLVAKGIDAITVSSTAFYYRRKKTGGVLSKDNSEAVLIRKTELFEPENFLRLPAKVESIAPTIPRVSTNHKDVLKEKLKHHTLAYQYLSTQWHLHRTTLGKLKHRLITKASPNLTIGMFDKSKMVQKVIEKNTHTVPTRMAEIGVSKTLIEEWGLLNRVEPLIRASWDMFEYIPILTYPVNSPLSDAYYNFCKSFHNNEFTDIIFVPHMIRGGAELATIHLTRALCKEGKRVLVVSSITSDSVWGGRIQEIEGAEFVENKDLLIDVPDEQMRMLFWARVVQYWNIQRITTINSEFGYKFINRYQRQLAEMKCKSYVHTYAFDITEDGYLFNYIPNGLVELYGAVDKYITDSQYYGELLQKINGFTQDDVRTLYLPVDSTKLTPKTDFIRKNKVIYAARICNQKIADVAVEVGRLLGEQGIELHFYGNIDPEYAENNGFLTMIEKIPSIKYMGTFDGFGALPLNDYDMYLLTTRTEGLANVVLEACLSNIYVVSVAVGGLPECITNGKNGFLLPDTNEKFNPQAYVDAIISAYQSNTCFNQEAIKAESLRISERHSLATYANSVAEVMK